MSSNRVDAIPYSHVDLDKWRANFVGIQHHHAATNFLVTGAVDDIWVNPKGELIVVDYKATSKKDEITSLNEEWHMSYKRQMEVYQWLLRQKGFSVSNTGYWVYANGDRTREKFDSTLTFRMTVIPYDGSSQWVEDALKRAKQCLDADKSPPPNPECDYCTYRIAVDEAEHSG